MQPGPLIGKGRTADVYTHGPDRILKLYQPWMPAQVVQREYEITRAALTAGLPVPAADALLELDGRCGIVFERLEGPSMLKELAARPWRLLASARLLGELHARVHACAAPQYLPAQQAQIADGIRAAKELSQDVQEICLRRLAALPEGASFCHGDFHPDNILMTPRGPYIIDWQTGTCGQPLADVARTCLLFETSALPPGTPPAARLLVNASRSLIQSVYLRRYFQLRPAGRRALDTWRLPLLAARLREVDAYPAEARLILERMRVIVEPSAG
jgi:uncharacterized protein (TIGR02172 family)